MFHCYPNFPKLLTLYDCLLSTNNSLHVDVLNAHKDSLYWCLVTACAQRTLVVTILSDGIVNAAFDNMLQSAC